MNISEVSLDEACRVLHDAYEAAAPHHGWQTQAKSAVPWEQVPKENRATMQYAVAVLLDWLEDQ